MHTTTEEIVQRPWICYYCGFETCIRSEAQGHFGMDTDEPAICLVWADLNADDRLKFTQEMVQRFEAEHEETHILKSTIEGLEYRLQGLESLLGSRFPGCKTINDAYNLYDFQVGRALLAEQKLAKLQASFNRLKRKHLLLTLGIKQK